MFNFAMSFSYSSVHDHPEEELPMLKPVTLVVQLALWAVKAKIPLMHLTSLLKILHSFHPDLPLDGRTLLGTPRKSATEKMGDGSFKYFGIEAGLRNLLCCKLIPRGITLLQLKVNTDGLPIAKSTGEALWPILCMVKECVIDSPFVIAAYVGVGKPSSVNLFLKDFVSELKVLLTNGFVFMGICYRVVFDCMVCDMPARAFVKAVKGHGGYCACEKCEVTGTYSNDYRKVIYTDLGCRRRTQESFFLQSQPEHHTGTSPLVELGVDLVTLVPLDYMHLVCLGVMKKLLLEYWFPAKLCITKISAHTKLAMSNHLISLRANIPVEFNRKPRSLADLKMWKATEFRQLLLYTGPVVFRKRMNEACYSHFLHLSAAIAVLISPSYCTNMLDVAKNLLTVFIASAGSLYGKGIYVMNVHSLIHLPDDVARFGPLDRFSCFPFENFLAEMKKMLRSPNNALKQVVNRLSELNAVTPVLGGLSDKLYTLRTPRNKLLPVPSNCSDYRQFERIDFRCFSLSTNTADSVARMRDGCIIKIQNILSSSTSVFLVGSVFMKIEDFYTTPVRSSDIGMFVASELNGQEMHLWEITRIQYKCVSLPLSNGEVLIVPLFHLV